MAMQRIRVRVLRLAPTLPTARSGMTNIQQNAQPTVRDFVDTKPAGSKFYGFAAGAHRAKSESKAMVTKRIKAGAFLHSRNPQDYRFGHTIVFESNSIANVDAVEKIFQSAFDADADLKAKCINRVSGAGGSHGPGTAKTVKADGSKRSYAQYLVSDQSKYNRVVGLTSVTPIYY